MMKANVLILVVIAVLMTGGIVSAIGSPPILKCYLCSGLVEDEDKDCSATGFLSSANKTKTVDCASGACVKTVTGLRVFRDCLGDSDMDRLYRFHGCKTESREQASGVSEYKICVCHNDYCNSGTIPTMSILLMALASLYVRIMV